MGLGPPIEIRGYTGLRGFLHILARFVPLALVVWDKLLLRLLMALCFNVVGVLGAVSVGKAADALDAARNPVGFYSWMFVALGVSVLSATCFGVYSVVSMYVKMRLDIRLKKLIFDHIQRLSLRFHESRPIGENMYRVNFDTVDASDIAANILPETGERIIGVLTTGSLVFLLNPLIALLLLIYIPVYYLSMHLIVIYAYRYQHYVRQRAQAALALLQENLSAFALSKAMARERHELRRYYERLVTFARAMIKYGMADSFWSNGGELLREWFMTLAYSLCCGYFVITDRLTIGEYIATAAILTLVTTPLQQFVWMIQRFRISAVPARRMLQTLDIAPEIESCPMAKKLDSPEGRIEFEHVYFRYTPDGPDVIKDLSFRVEAGKKLAIVGASGAGKSSIFNLALRYYDPTAGSVLVDGHDLRNIDLESYRRQVSIVLQDSFLFSATIRDNVLFGDISADEQQFQYAIERAGLESLLKQLPKGADTLLSEGGNLSAGHKQRIAIARAVIREPTFLFLDEATSALDPVTELEILEQLRRISAGKTCLIIAHSISAVQDADEVLVMHRGVLVQRGTHEALLKEGGHYGRMWAAEMEKWDTFSGTPGAKGEAHD